MMTQQFDTIQKASKEQVDAALKSFAALSKGVQAVAVESSDFAKKSFEQSTAVFEKLAGAKSLDKALEIQTEYMKSAFEAAVAQATKFGEIYNAIAKDAAKPYEGLFAKVAPTAAK
jgi:phasin family protein